MQIVTEITSDLPKVVIIKHLNWNGGQQFDLMRYGRISKKRESYSLLCIYFTLLNKSWSIHSLGTDTSIHKHMHTTAACTQWYTVCYLKRTWIHTRVIICLLLYWQNKNKIKNEKERKRNEKKKNRWTEFNHMNISVHAGRIRSIFFSSFFFG